jgi:Skp family chaperone for outer membrane proteins
MTEGRHAAYARRVQQDAQRCAETLLADNERLRKQVALLEGSRSDLERRLRDSQEGAAIAEALRALAASLEAEKLRLQQRVATLEAELEHARQGRATLERQLADVEAESRRAVDEYAEVQQRVNNLANLYVASYQLHETLDRQAVLAAIREIVVNLVGSEGFAVFELDSNNRDFVLADGVGIDALSFGPDQPATRRIAQLARAGEVVLAPPQDAQDGRPLVACVPLLVAGRVLGAIAVLHLLPHKPRLEPIDRELFDLLAAQAGTALYFTKLHQAALGRQTEPTSKALPQTHPDNGSDLERSTTQG